MRFFNPFLGTSLFVLCVIGFGVVSVGHSQTIRDWDNTTGTEAWYQLGSNWDGGNTPSDAEKARFNQSASYEVWWDAATASTTPSAGFFEALLGDVDFLNKDSDTQHLFTINGSGDTGEYSDFSISGNSTNATVSGLHFHSLGGGQVVNGGTLTLDGSHEAGSKLTVSGSTGFEVSGQLNVNSGAVFENTLGRVGDAAGSVGAVTISGVGSQWNNSDMLLVGRYGDGTLNLVDGGVVNNANGFLGTFAGSTGAASVSGLGSQWNTNGLWVGREGNGTLDVSADGAGNSSGDVTVGWSAGSTGTINVTGDASQWNFSDDLYVGSGGDGTINILDGGSLNSTEAGKDVYLGYAVGANGTVTVSGEGSSYNGRQDGERIYIGYRGTGTLNILNNGLVSSGNSQIASVTGSTGVVTVSGAGSRWNAKAIVLASDGNLTTGGNGTLNILDGGYVENFNTNVAGVGGSGTVLVRGVGSGLESDNIVLGYKGTGTLDVESGGAVISRRQLLLGRESGTSGQATVSGAGSQINVGTVLFVAQGGRGTLNVLDGGLFSCELADLCTGQNAGNGIVNVNGGQFISSSDLNLNRFGFDKIGNALFSISNGGIVSVAGTTKLWKAEGTLTLDGGSFLTGTLDNTLGGTFNFNSGNLGITDSSQSLTVGASSFSLSNGTAFNTDSGTTTLAAGESLEIAGASTVDSGAVLAMAGGSLKSSLLTNEGMIHTTSGNSIIFGDVQSNGSFQVETGSSLIFADDFFGADEFSGGGAVTFQGGLNPGLSPGTIEFSGDVILGENSMTTIEIAGLTSDEFDRLVFVNPDSILTIEEGAALDVQLINGFGLGYSQEFIFSDLAGSNSPVGTFSGLGEGDLVGSFGGIDLFISYAAGSGNDISLFTAVPEPSTFLVAAIALGALGIPRRRRKRIIA